MDVIWQSRKMIQVAHVIIDKQHKRQKEPRMKYERQCEKTHLSSKPKAATAYIMSIGVISSCEF